ncbi:MAG: hypothetical protein WCO06_00435 [Candidatus Roizmanbacteria bacterium]
MEYIKNNKKLLYIFVIIIGVIVIAVVFAVMTRSNAKKQVKKVVVNSELPDVAVIPTIESSVGVQLNQLLPKKEVEFIFNNIPQGTERIELELTFKTTEKDQDGSYAEIKIESGAKSGKQKFVFGTASSGVMRYVTVVGDISLNAVFHGSYGERMLTKNFSL